MGAKLNILFLGTAELARVSLTALAEHPDFQLLSVVTQPDRPKGRDLKLQASPVKVEAAARGLPVLQPERVKRPEALAELSQFQPDLIVVAAYGQILPPALLELPRYGCLNVHASLLPKYRGAAPIQWAILNGDNETGVTIMKMDAGLDTGDILTQASLPIDPADTSQTLHDKLARLGADLLLKTIPGYVAGSIRPQKQPDSGVSYARKITKQDGSLDWALPAQVLLNRVRGLTPWPGAFTYLHASGRPQMLKILEAAVAPEAGGEPGLVLRADAAGLLVACQEGAVRILRLQREGGRPLTAAQFISGYGHLAGQRLARPQLSPAGG